jgi:hypothetical protein
MNSANERSRYEEKAMSLLAFAGQTPSAPAIDDPAASVIRPLRTARREVERDRDIAKTFIARASSLLQVEAARRVAPDRDLASGGFSLWQVHRVITFVEEHPHETIHVKDLSDVVRLSATGTASSR